MMSSSEREIRIAAYREIRELVEYRLSSGAARHRHSVSLMICGILAELDTMIAALDRQR
jgi:hypothetical protein